MIRLSDLFDLDLLLRMIDEGYVRRTTHPSLPLAILNYTEKAAYDRLWNDVTRQCRGLIYEQDPSKLWPIVARPFPKFFNYGEPDAPDLDLDAPAVVTDKLDGSLGILYPTIGGMHEIATRGSFTSDQALHATAVYQVLYENRWTPPSGLTYLFEIIYPENRIVCDYGDTDDLFLLDVLDTKTGTSEFNYGWPGPIVSRHLYSSLAEALRAEPRKNTVSLDAVAFGDDLGDHAAAWAGINAPKNRAWVHTFVNIDGVALGADHDLDEAIERVRSADAVFWVDHPLRHDLTVRVVDLNYFYAARRPK